LTWSVFGNFVDPNSIDFLPIPLKNAEWMGHGSQKELQKHQIVSQKIENTGRAAAVGSIYFSDRGFHLMQSDPVAGPGFY
jgi:hypothetical protein